jgi:predicted DNA binding CopG/RHH family protein
VRSIKTKEGKGIKRVNINIPTDLHNAFKSATAAQGLEMTVVLLEFIEKYVAKNGPAPPKQLKSRRA